MHVLLSVVAVTRYYSSCVLINYYYIGKHAREVLKLIDIFLSRLRMDKSIHCSLFYLQC